METWAEQVSRKILMATIASWRMRLITGPEMVRLEDTMLSAVPPSWAISPRSFILYVCRSDLDSRPRMHKLRAKKLAAQSLFYENWNHRPAPGRQNLVVPHFDQGPPFRGGLFQPTRGPRWRCQGARRTPRPPRCPLQPQEAHPCLGGIRRCRRYRPGGPQGKRIHRPPA